MSSTSICLLIVIFTFCAEHCMEGANPSLYAKPGGCPRNDAICHGGTPGDTCNRDDHCPGARKCCPGPCGNTCAPPTGVKPGACPPVGLTSRLALDKCKKDADCPGEQRCCHGEDGLKCFTPEKEKPKSCPAEIFKCTKLGIDKCTNDSQCLGAKKCCFTKCYLQCVDPR